MRALSESKVVAVPNVTPMIDVMMVLLIIFMVVTPTLMSGVVAEPPVGDNLQPRPVQEGDHTLAIDARGDFFLDKQPVTAAGLRQALTALYPASATNRVLFVRAHRELEFGAVDGALTIARSSGVAVVGLVTEQRPRPE